MNFSPNPDWSDFDVYFALRERGLRREAFQRLDVFLNYLSLRPFAEQKDFVCWLYFRPGEAKNLPHPLRTRFVEPVLREWIRREPDHAAPRLWLGGISNLWEAYRLDPSSSETRLQLVDQVLEGIGYEMHELPWGFLGDAMRAPDETFASRCAGWAAQPI